MATFPDSPHDGPDGAEPVRSVLRIEMQAAERGVLTLFAASFLEWIRDARGSRFARDAGAPTSVSFDEASADEETATLRVTVTWPRLPAAADDPTVPVARSITVGDAAGAAAEGDPSTSLFYEAPTPTAALTPAALDLTAMVAEVFARSKSLPGHSPPEDRTPPPRFGPLLIAAERATEWAERWTAEASGHARNLLDRGRRRARVAAESRRAPRPARLDGMRVVVRVPKVSRTGISPVSLVTAGLGLAALLAVVYVGWPAETLTTPAVAPPFAAAVPSPPVPTSAVDPEARPDVVSDVEAQMPAAVAALHAPPVPASVVAAREPRPKPAAAAPLPRGYFGSLIVTSEPGGADVTVDGLPRGRTPLSITRLNVGSRVVRVDMAGHQPWAWAVSVVANKETAVVVKLLPAVASHDSTGAEPDRRSTDPRR